MTVFGGFSVDPPRMKQIGTMSDHSVEQDSPYSGNSVCRRTRRGPARRSNNYMLQNRNTIAGTKSTPSTVVLRDTSGRMSLFPMGQD
ncbi:hypothetical protein EKPJFOCH_0374 [Methylobacterium thuringiense]|uniref:Uncharacterized protein n=1 Tax=Methylobacterium thuringiense TaxID=1003091 RepID=A0ABQ4TFW0_9HYPH|nr:hypothetical protein EKPJFOCH_0374 [Methylobacterium thuringiense]